MNDTIFAGFGGLAVVLTCAALMAQDGTASEENKPLSVLSFTVQSIDGAAVNLSRYRGKVLLIVNTASRCGYTPQYAALEKIYQRYKDRGLAILAFPSNDFGGQEPGSNEQIREFCESKYNVTFDLFAKIAVRGQDQAPLYRFLTSRQTNPQFGGDIGWNFTKFLVGRDGRIVARYESKITPDSEAIIQAIEAELAKAPPR